MSQWPPHSGSAVDPAAAYHRFHEARRRQRSWTIALVALGVLVVALAAATVAVTVAQHIHTSSSGPQPAHGSIGTTTPPTVALPPVTATPGGPTITAVTPSQASPGQTVTITGSNLFSANGEVLAYFGGVVAPTACASESTCTATVPPHPPGANRVNVTVTTAAGSSNGVPFTFD